MMRARIEVRSTVLEVDVEIKNIWLNGVQKETDRKSSISDGTERNNDLEYRKMSRKTISGTFFIRTTSHELGGLQGKGNAHKMRWKCEAGLFFSFSRNDDGNDEHTRKSRTNREEKSLCDGGSIAVPKSRKRRHCRVDMFCSKLLKLIFLRIPHHVNQFLNRKGGPVAHVQNMVFLEIQGIVGLFLSSFAFSSFLVLIKIFAWWLRLLWRRAFCLKNETALAKK